MNNYVIEIEKKIKRQKEIPDMIKRIDSLINNENYLLSDIDIKNLENEKLKLEKELVPNNINLQQKHRNFFYSKDEIINAPDISWLITNLIPKQSIGVLIGASGVGKTTFVVNCCQMILKSHANVFIVYIDGDMSGSKIKEIGAHKLMDEYENRFMYAGKTNDYFSDRAQNLLQDIISEQKKYPDRSYLIIEDSLTLVAKKTRGFIDTEFLYKYEREIRALNGTCLVILHKNKAGVFADSQQIINYCDYSYELERNDFNSCIVLHPRKASRFDIQGKAFFTEDRKIIKEVDYDSVNISFRESQFVNFVLDALEEGELNQSELLNHLEKIRFFSEFKVGQKKAIRWLREWADKGKWKYEQRVGKKNAIYYWLDINSETEKLAKLPNNDLMEIQNGY
ncbi:AAA family ATPase [Aliarcobacter butzleri]|uniref:AAA family ATPase n=1 Tax=Aliarcobacter butzleri TaxID=28197 RepID=UPI002B254131|nr:AAA family ATPase [Aliarcobacter butzleri]